MVLKQPMPQVKYVDLDHMIGFADRGETWVSNLRDDLLEPWPRKQSPMVTASRLAKLCKVERARIQYLVTKGNAKGEYPTGSTSGNNRHREFSIEDVQAFVRRAGPYAGRPDNARGVAIAVGNFKGGVGKTTLSVALAQGLTLRGHKVLLVDLDPQASSTTLMGYVPTAEIGEAQTVMPFIYGDEPNLDYSIVESYWPNLHLIPASPVLFGADYYLPAKQSRDPNYEYWAVLEQAMPRLRDQYDVIVFDTPPSLAYLATNCFMSSDALVIPLPPETLDFVSSTAFFRQFADLFSGLKRNREVEKRFEFIKIFLSKVRPRVQSTSVVSSWIQEAYPEMLGRAELFESDVVKKASTEFKTVYDLDPRDYEGSMQLLGRTLDAFDDMIDEIQEQLEGIWSAQKTEKEVSHGK